MMFIRGLLSKLGVGAGKPETQTERMKKREECKKERNRGLLFEILPVLNKSNIRPL
jgi:hypothetical protein